MTPPPATPPPPPPSPRSPAAGRRRRLLRWSIIVALLGVQLGFGSALWVRLGARGHLFAADAAPAAPVAIVLGARTYADGTPSPLLAARLDVAKRLYDRGTVRAILVSGDNSRPEYDEPGAMHQYLLARGVPERKVVADYAGFDTYDTCLRANRIFGVTRAIVVTQGFHLARAVTLCRSVGVDADGVADETMAVHRRVWIRGLVREQAAAVKAAFDVLTRRDPVFLGPHEPGIDNALRD